MTPQDIPTMAGEGPPDNSSARKRRSSMPSEPKVPKAPASTKERASKPPKAPKPGKITAKGHEHMTKAPKAEFKIPRTKKRGR